MIEPSPGDLLAAIKVQGTKIDGIKNDINEVKITLEKNTDRLSGLEKWIESHDAIVRFVKWLLAITAAIAGPIIALWAAIRFRGN